MDNSNIPPNINNPDAAPAQPQPTVIVQQVQTIKNLHGLGGWLMFFLICFAITGLSSISASIFGIFVPNNTSSSIITAIFMPFLAATTLIAVVFIALQFKLARIFSIATYAVGAVYSSVITLVAISEISRVDGAVWAGAIVGVVTSLIVYALLALYFIVSKRVKETLIKEVPKNIAITVLSAAGGVAVILAILGVIFSATAKKADDYPAYSDDYDYGDVSETDTDNSDNITQPEMVTKTINQTITDTELGYTIKVKRAIFNVPFDDNYDVAYYKSAAVEVEVNNHSNYYNSFSSYDLELVINGQTASQSDYNFQDFIEQSDKTLLPSSTSRGNTSTGWIFFYYDTTLKGDIVFTYNRSAATTTDGKTIPAKKFEITLN